jgi:hypothetical protein
MIHMLHFHGVLVFVFRWSATAANSKIRPEGFFISIPFDRHAMKEGNEPVKQVKTLKLRQWERHFGDGKPCAPAFAAGCPPGAAVTLADKS